MIQCMSVYVYYDPYVYGLHPPPPTPHTHTTQETESSLRRVQQRMLEAEKRMIQDDILGSNDMLVSSNEFGKPRGTLTIIILNGVHSITFHFSIRKHEKYQYVPTSPLSMIRR